MTDDLKTMLAKASPLPWTTDNLAKVRCREGVVGRIIFQFDADLIVHAVNSIESREAECEKYRTALEEIAKPTLATEAEAIAAWNRRAASPELRDLSYDKLIWALRQIKDARTIETAKFMAMEAIEESKKATVLEEYRAARAAIKEVGK